MIKIISNSNFNIKINNNNTNNKSLRVRMRRRRMMSRMNLIQVYINRMKTTYKASQGLKMILIMIIKNSWVLNNIILCQDKMKSKDLQALQERERKKVS